MQVRDGPAGQVHLVDGALAVSERLLGDVEEAAVGRNVAAVEGGADLPRRLEEMERGVVALHQPAARGDVEQVAARVENQVAVVGNGDQRARRQSRLQFFDLQVSWPACRLPAASGTANS